MHKSLGYGAMILSHGRISAGRE